MTLDYDSNTQELDVTITHSAPEQDHFIERVTVSVNGSQVLNEEYTSQPTSPFTYTYNISAVNGATIECTAICSISGSITRSITVGGDGTQNGGGEIPGYPSLILILLVSTGVIFELVRNKIKSN